MGLLDPPALTPLLGDRRYGAPPRSVATRTGTSYYGLSDGVNQSQTNRTRHIATADITSISLVYGNHYGNNGSPPYQTDGTATLTVKASVDYGGALYRGFFSGSSRTVTLEPGAGATTSPIAVKIPAGATFWVRTYVAVPAPGDKWPVGLTTDSGSGEGVTNGSDLTASGTVSLVSGKVFGPLAIVGTATTLKASVGYVGDSIITYYNDLVDQGFMFRALNNAVGSIRICQPGEKASDFATPLIREHRERLLKYLTHAVCNYGRNDLGNGDALGTIQANLITVWGLLAQYGIKTWQTTITPRSTSTDSFATVANQTATGGPLVRTPLNAWLRDGCPLLAGVAVATGSSATGTLRAGMSGHPLVGIIDVSGVCEDAADPTKWKATGATNYATTDGLHPSTALHILMAAVVPVSSFTV